MTEENRHATADAATRAQLIYAFRRIFGPLARILQRAGVPYYEFRDILKAAYIEAALRDGIPGYPEMPSTAAVACLLGVPEADIRNLVRNPDVLKPPPETTAALICAILTKWSTDTNFQGPYGLPQQLALESPAGRSFSDLVRSVQFDANPKQLWEEMITNGTTEQVGAQHVRMSGRQLVMGTSMLSHAYEVLGRAMEDLARTIAHNQAAPLADKLIQRSVFSDRPLPESKASEFSQFVRTVMQDALVEIDDWLTQNVPQQSDEPAIDVGVTVFEYKREPVREIPLRDLITEAPATKVPAWVQVSELNTEKT
jgi:hypothetical protein